MGILNLWQQIGRRYFWPQILFRMFSASFKVLLLQGISQEVLPQDDNYPSLSRQSLFQIGFSQLARLKNISRHPTTYTVDYWHQNAMRVVMRHLSIAWVPAPLHDSIAPLYVQDKIFLTTLFLLFNSEVWSQWLFVRQLLRSIGHVVFIDNCINIHLTQQYGIRAGPHAIG